MKNTHIHIHAKTKDSPDSVSLEVPALILLLEWARETASEDVQMHKVVEASSESGDTITSEIINTLTKG